MANLIVLRGPSGSGKTTVAKELFKSASSPMVLIEQDHYRYIFNPPGGHIQSRTIHEMIQQDTLSAVRHGYDVILEGILTKRSYGDVFENMFRAHPEDNYVFTFDLSLAETIRRHRTRVVTHDFTDDDIRGWYTPRDFLGCPFEYIVTEQSSLEQTLAMIRRTTREVSVA